MKSKSIRASEYADEQCDGRYLNLDTPEGLEWANHFINYLNVADKEEEYYNKHIKMLEEDRNAFIGFCHNIIDGIYVSVIDAAKEQLKYLENKIMEE